MVTDHELALMLRDAGQMERVAAEYFQELPPHDLAERDQALILKRHSTALRKSLEGWMATRSLRAALKK